MKKIINTIQTHKATFIVSLLSAVLAVILQLTITSLAPRDTRDDLQNIYLEDAKGFVVSQNTETEVVHGSNMLQEGDQTQLQRERVVEDDTIRKYSKEQQIMITSLIVPLDTKGETGEDNMFENRLRIQLANAINSNMSVCETSKQTGKSCMAYLTNKSAQSIPVDISLISSLIPNEFNLQIRYPMEALAYSGSFSGKPVELDIRPL